MEYTMMELLPVVKYLSDRYTGKESGSLPYELASQLMEAVIYCIREYEQSGREPGISSDSGELYDTASRPEARQAYDAGYQLVMERAAQAKERFDSLTKTFHAYGCMACYDTVIKGMPSFFLNYDARFHPQDHILTLDYPVLVSQDHLCGIDRILAYLNCIQAEQNFLGKFPETLVRRAIAARQPDYRELFENLAGIMLRYCLGCLMVKKTFQTITFDRTDYEVLKQAALSCDQQELEGRLLELLEMLIQQGYAGDRQLFQYLSADIHDFAVMMIHGAEHDCMETVL